MNLRFSFPILVALAACSPTKQAERPPLEGASIGGAFSLTDQNGRVTTDRDFAGKYRIMYFGYTFCPDICPLDVQNISAAVKIVEKEQPGLGARIVPVFVTIDPARDNPAALRQFTAAFHPRLVGLTGSPDQIARVAREYGVYYARGQGSAGGYLMDHSRAAYLMAPDGKPLALLSQEGPPRKIADEIERWAK
ncbi:SCO family protein [Sphingomonas sp. TX0543]|uniref:SCO family protein n=1 Tax=unclassified Sphingomonas TaxID=196159 RepID=UPI0010F9585B|nr:SCO family protein [Sphingomonas sp. 3P27F8]